MDKLEPGQKLGVNDAAIDMDSENKRVRIDVSSERPFFHIDSKNSICVLTCDPSNEMMTYGILEWAKQQVRDFCVLKEIRSKQKEMEAHKAQQIRTQIMKS